MLIADDCVIAEFDGCAVLLNDDVMVSNDGWRCLNAFGDEDVIGANNEYVTLVETADTDVIVDLVVVFPPSRANDAEVAEDIHNLADAFCSCSNLIVDEGIEGPPDGANWQLDEEFNIVSVDVCGRVERAVNADRCKQNKVDFDIRLAADGVSRVERSDWK